MLSRRDAAVCVLAYEAAARAGLGFEARRIAVAQWWAESRCGMRVPFLLPDGRPSYNMGATTARTADVPSFGGNDRDKDGNPIKQRWAYFSNMDQGVAYWLTFGSVTAGRAALEAGDVVGYSRALYRGGYYSGVEGTDEQRIASYAAMLRGAMAQIEPAIAETNMGRHVVVATVVALPLAAWAAWKYLRP